MNISSKAFLITGGSGFVGSHLVEALLERRAARVVVFDREVSERNLGGLVAEPRVQIVRGDVANARDLSLAFQGINGVFHMAVLPLGACESDPTQAFEVNIRGTFQIIRQAANAGVDKLVYSSASSVYGDTLDVMDEQHPFNPWTMYGVSKLCGEFLLRPFHRKVASVVLRYMNVYGPRQQAGLIPSVLSKIRSGKSPEINGDGSASFDFVHVRDVIRCNLLAMESDIAGESFNVGSGTEATVKEIVTMLLDLSGSALTPTYRRDVPVLMTRRVGSSEKAKRLLGFQATVPLRRGLEELVKEPPV
jgi:UDP-glucose 4-epimerase